MKLSPYLHFKGECRAAFEHYAQIFGSKVEDVLTYGQSPVAAQTPADWRDKVMHTQLQVGDQLLMGADSPPQFQTPMQGFSVTLIFDEPAEAERVFTALAEGGTVRMPLQETFWAKRFGMLTDRFGVPWIINGGMQMG
jgi:PhnB protein